MVESGQTTNERINLSMVIQQHPIGLLGSNCYLIIDPETADAAIVDPGVDDAAPILKIVREQRLNVSAILNTHGHFDHVAGNGLLASPQTRLGCHPADRELLLSGGGSRLFGFNIPPSPRPNLDLVDGLTLTIGKLEITVMHTPGHSPGSICLHVPQDHALLTGDTLFRGGVGRTDLPGGDAHALRTSLARLVSRLTPYPEEIHIYPGHGPATTLKQEMATNPWLRAWTGKVRPTRTEYT
jgi:hydroxyacylglutathione hydrolase